MPASLKLFSSFYVCVLDFLIMSHIRSTMGWSVILELPRHTHSFCTAIYFLEIESMPWFPLFSHKVMT